LKARFGNCPFFESLIHGQPVITGILPVERALEAFDLAADISQELKVQIAFEKA
jgi:L-idonate 5-dehydrogenase